MRRTTLSLSAALAAAVLSVAAVADDSALAREELRAYLGDASDFVLLKVDSSLDAEAWSVKGAGGKVELRGGSARGLCYAAYEFLEREIGVRWLTPWGDEYAPDVRAVPDRAFEYSGKPKLDCRWFVDFGNDVRATKGGRRFLFRQRHNFIDGEKSLPLGWQIHSPKTHSIHFYIPPAKYFAEHPEYFSMDAGGKRVRDNQLCFSNPGLVAELDRVFLAHVDACGGSGVFDLCALDHPGAFCLCRDCRAAVERYGTEGAPYFIYVRHLAELLFERRPGAILHFTLYRVAQTETPPSADFGSFPANCAAVFAPIENDFSKRYTHANNRIHAGNLSEWAKRVPRLWEWYYPLPYGGFPLFSGVGKCADDLAFAYRVGLSGGTFEHDVGTRVGAGFADLLTYLISRLYCDPEQAWRPIAEEFCRLYYGAAAADVLALMDELDAIAEAHARPLAWNAGLDEAGDPAFLAKWSERLNAAERALGGDAALVQRLREFRLALDLAVLRNYKKLQKALPSSAEPADAVLARALATARAAVDRRFTEPKVANQFYAKFAQAAQAAHRRATVTPKPLPEPFASMPEGDVVEILARPTCNAKSRPDPDAAIGVAVYDPRHFERPLEKYEIGFFDRAGKRQFPRRTIAKDEVVPDRYHFYLLGRHSLTRDCLVYLSWTWRLQFELGEYWMPGGEDEWDIYVSLKLEGPMFSPLSKSKENRVSFDRAVLVRAPKGEAGTAAGAFELEGAAVVARAPQTVKKGVEWFEEAAADLTNFLSIVTGSSVPLYREGQEPKGLRRAIFLGDTAAAGAAGIDMGKLPRAGFRVKFGSGRGFIAASTGMGASFGVTDFLQRQCGVYWPSRDGRSTARPRRGLKIPDMDEVREPAIYSTCVYDGRFPIGDGVTEEHLRRGRPKTIAKWWSWERRNRMHGINAEYENAHRVTELIRPNHTAFCYCPPEKYAKDHPEYYSLRENGKRSWKANAGGQLCYTNPDVRRIVYESLRRFVETDRAADPVRYPTIYDFSQLDNAGNGFCFCDACRAVCAKYNATPGGARDGGTTGLQLEFVNDVAGRIAADYPDVKIRTFAYTITTVIPKGIVPAPNVMIQFCDIYSKSDHQRPLDAGPFNPRQHDWLKGWCAIARNIEVWDYFYPSGPDVSVDGVAGDARIFRDLGIKRLFMETEYRHHPFWELGAFVMSQKYFDPDVSTEALVDAYCDVVYGKAAPQMRRTIDFVRGLIRDNPPADNWSWHMRVLPWRNRENVVAIGRLAREAYKAADDAFARGRVAELLSQCADELIRFDRVDPSRRDSFEKAKAAYLRYLDEDLATGAYEASEANVYRKKAQERIDLLNVRFSDMPAEFSSVPESDIIRLDFRSLQGNRVRRTPDTAAEGGFSFVWDKGKSPFPLKCDINDIQLKTHTPYYLKPSSADCDGRFHWHRVGVARIGRNSQFCFPSDWELKFPLSQLYAECDGLAEDPNWYEFWLSLRTDGKTLFAADRLLLRRTKATKEMDK